ncbi:MAG: undecaprenyl/decaprenyl-phosphate alpha-N-acetylglucosaminyl 1-phosphate transferase [Methylophilaceae bacterium]|nr:undecaprenyl/decaprenyl-phosphate alpha-N-acetylglucosaminyl 1-phosphate transferase [Methylophilaceae bacterium]
MNFVTNKDIFYLVLAFLFFSSLVLFFKNHKKTIPYSSIQRIHIDNTPRLGGFCIYGSLVISYFLFDYEPVEKQILMSILIFGGIILFGTLKEDITFNISPLTRFIICFVATILFFIYSKFELPIVDLIYLSQLLETPLFTILFYSFATVSVTNGFNLIDGTNGLCGSTAFCGFAGLLFLSINTGNSLFTTISIIYLFLISLFLCFNYPKGKLFLGDSGAYFLGFSLSCLIVLFFGFEHNISPWNAVLILFYPIIETIFSFFRKIFWNKISPFSPDAHHLHLKIFFLLKDSQLIDSKLTNNNLVLPLLFTVWGTPLLILPWVYEHESYVIGSILFMTIGYLIFYRWIPNHVEVKSN